MKPVDMTVLHDPGNGKYGDCQRACIASLLELDSEAVTHFYESGKADDFDRLLNEYLETQNLVHIETKPINFSLDQFTGKGDLYHMIYGETIRGTYHAVVALNGVVVHDPHPSKDGLLEDDRENWSYGFLVKTCKG